MKPVALLLVTWLVAWPLNSAARGVYLTAEQFLAEGFPAGEPDFHTLWLSPELRARGADLLDRPLPLRVRYWRSGERTAWILDEIGKTHPITIGVVVERDAIAAIRVLEFRESRGDEVRFPFFTQQFEGAALSTGDSMRLDRHIDGITGATLSVRAMGKVARLALLLHAEVTHGSS